MTPALAVVLGFLAHFVGDYVLQSDYMAAEKTKAWPPAVQHGLLYAVPFLPILWVSDAPLWALVLAMAVIAGTHIPIDHWRLARHVGWAKNQMAPARWRHRWDDHVATTGYHAENTGDGGLYTVVETAGTSVDGVSLMRGDRVLTRGQRNPRCSAQAKPVWMSVWLMIITDNTIHVTINTAALLWAVTR